MAAEIRQQFENEEKKRREIQRAWRKQKNKNRSQFMGTRGDLNNSEHDYMYRSHTMGKADKVEINNLGFSEYPIS